MYWRGACVRAECSNTLRAGSSTLNAERCFPKVCGVSSVVLTARVFFERRLSLIIFVTNDRVGGINGTCVHVRILADVYMTRFCIFMSFMYIVSHLRDTRQSFSFFRTQCTSHAIQCDASPAF